MTVTVYCDFLTFFYTSQASIGLFVKDWLIRNFQQKNYLLNRSFFGLTGKIIKWRLPRAVDRKTDLDFHWLKTPTATSVAPGARYTVSRLNGSHGPGRQLARYRTPVCQGASLLADSNLAFFKVFRSYTVSGSLAVTSDDRRVLEVNHHSRTV